MVESIVDKVKAEDYHRMHLVTPELYIMEGDVHPHFHPKKNERAKNLLVIPGSYRPFLQERKTRDNSTGAAEALSSFGKYRDNTQWRRVSIGNGLNGTIYPVTRDALDVLVTDDWNGDASNIRSNVKSLGELADKENFRIVTTRMDIGIELPDYPNLRVRPPRFLPDPAILQKAYIPAPQLVNLVYGGGKPKEQVDPRDLEKELGETLIMNQFYWFTNNKGHRQHAWYNGKEGYIELIDTSEMNKLSFNKHVFRDGLFGVKPQNVEQYLVMQKILLNENIQFAAIHGVQGSGKNMVVIPSVLAMGVHWLPDILNNILPTHLPMSASRKARYEHMKDMGCAYNKLIFYKAEFGASSVGWLPGDYSQKTGASFTHYQDSFEKTSMFFQDRIQFSDLFTTAQQELAKIQANIIRGNGSKGSKSGAAKFTPMVKGGRDYKLPSEYPLIHEVNWDQIRGRTFSRVALVLDEQQNDVPAKIKKTLGRIADDTKAIVVGDIRQIDNLHLSPSYNAFMYALKHVLGPDQRGRADCAFFHLQNPLRDPIAALFYDMKAHQI